MAFQKDGLSSWLYLIATFLITFTVIGLADASGVFVAVFVDHYKETNAKTGWVISLALFLLYALTPLVVYIYHRLGYRWCMIISSFFYVLAFLVTPFMPSLNFLFISYSIPFGIVASLVGTLSITTQRKYFDKYYGFAVGVCCSSNSLGAIAFSFTLPIIIQAIGVEKTFLCLLALTPVFICSALAYLSNVDGTESNFSSRTEHLTRRNIYYEFLQDKSFLIYLASSGVFFFTAVIPMIYMIRYAVTLGYPLSKAKWLLVVRNVATFPTRLISGLVGDIMLKRGKVYLVAEITYLLFGLLSFLCSFVRSFPLLLLYMGVSGVVEGVFWVTFPLLLVEVTGGYHADEAFAAVCLVAAFSLLLGAPAMGWLFDETGDFRSVFYTIFATSSIAAFLLAVSSCVTVEKSLSIREKAKHLKNCELTAENAEPKIPRSILWMYETSL